VFDPLTPRVNVWDWLVVKFQAAETNWTPHPPVEVAVDVKVAVGVGVKVGVIVDVEF
jgi:hypothetical protein